MSNHVGTYRRRNTFLYLTVILGLTAVALSVLPNFITPTVVSQQTTLRAMIQLTATPVPLMTPTATPATATPTLRPPSTAGCERYPVQVGDTLRSVAEQFGVSQSIIAQTNNLHRQALNPGSILIVCRARPAAATQVPITSPVTGTVEVLMTLLYPVSIHNRQPQWITLSIARPEQRIAVAGISLPPDIIQATTQASVQLHPLPTPRTAGPRATMLVERWLSADLTGSDITPRSMVGDRNKPLSQLVMQDEPLIWQWLFHPLQAGEYLFGLDVMTYGEYEVVSVAGEPAPALRTAQYSVWSQGFTISVDEIFGIPRQWWLLIASLGAVVNLILALVQAVGST